MTGIDGLERVIRDWVNSFETRPVGESKPMRLSADSVALHRVKRPACGRPLGAVLGRSCHSSRHTALPPGVVCSSGRLPQMVLYPCGCRYRVIQHVEVPDPDNPPALRRKFGVDSLIACRVRFDLSVPELSALTCLELRGMAVPERSVHEDSEPRATERDVGSAGQVPAMTTPAADPESPESPSEHELGLCVPALDAGHDPAAFLRTEDVRHLASPRAVPWAYGTSLVRIKRSATVRFGQ